MTKEELKAFAESDEGKSVFKDVVKSFGYHPKDDFDAVLANKNELLAEYKTFKKQHADKIDIDMDEYNELLDLKKSGALDIDVDEIKKENARLSRELDKTTKDYSSQKETLDNLQKKIDNSNIEKNLFEHIKSSGVAEQYHDVLIKAMRGSATIQDGEVLMNNDSGDVVPIKDYFTEWSESDKSKAFKTGNAGVNGQPPKGSASKTSYTREELQNPEIRRQYAQQLKAGNSTKMEPGK